MVLFFFFAIISSCIATSEYSSNKWSEYWNDPSLIATINPWIKVQNVIGEGIGWEGTSESAQQSANHVVISIMGKDEGLDVDVPYAKRPIVVKSISPLKCVIEQGNGDFEDCSMDAETPKTFYTNSFGRVSFSVPLQDQVQTKSNLVLPAIMVQTEYMSSDEWIVAHIDNDATYLLSRLTPNNLKQLNASLSNESAAKISSLVNEVMGNAQNHQVTESVYNKRFGNIILNQDIGSYDSILNIGKTLKVKVFDSSNLHLQFDRHLNSPFLKKRSEDEDWSLFEDKTDEIHQLSTVESSWGYIKAVFHRIGLSIANVLNYLKRLFSYSDILRTNQFLGNFYRLLSPLGIRGMEVLKYRYKNLIINMTDKAQGLFENITSSLGAHDLTLEAMRANALKASKMAASSDSFPENYSALNSDARTHFLHDRVINNLENADLQKLQDSPAVVRMGLVMKQFAEAIEGAVSLDILKTAHWHTLQFQKGHSILKVSLAQIFNFMQSLIMIAGQVTGKVLEAIMNLLPFYWNLAVEIMLTPLHIPFLRKWWKSLTRGTAEFTFLDVFTLLGSIYATFLYKLFNKNKAPFNDKDIAVLKKVQEPELLLYTWNHDPMTYAMDSPQLQRHRLGIYDWIPRMTMTVVGTLTTLAFDVALVIGGGNQNNPGPLSKFPQVFSAVASIMGRIQGFPFTQLESNEKAVIEKSKLNPDQRFLGFWTFWIIEDVVKFVRPFLGHTFNSYPGYANLNLLITGIPLTFYGCVLNYESGKQVAADDWPRWGVIGTYWFEIALLYIDPISLPYFENYREKSFNGDTALVEKFRGSLRLFKIWKDGLSKLSEYTRNSLLVGFHIVGMLSSSWQGGTRQGDGSRPEKIWYE